MAATNGGAVRTKTNTCLSRTVVVTMANRTALQRARKGGYKDMSVQELLIAYFKVRLARARSRHSC